jgi:alpha-tubulin suppressor-like RCC1 family protein
VKVGAKARIAALVVALVGSLVVLPAKPAAAIEIVGSVSGGYLYACAVTASNDAYCWGSNAYGQLGNATNVSSSTPVLVSGGHKWSKIDAGWHSTCGIALNGDAYCWGRNDQGQLGDNGGGDANVPVLVSGSHSWSSISVGENLACGVASAVAYCWGRNSIGQLGDNSTVNKWIPTAVSGGGTWLSVSAGSQNSCGLKAGGVGYCWGVNNKGQLGDGTGSNSTVPVLVAGAHTWTSIEAGDNFACAVESGTSDGFCWGANDSGEIGDGTTKGQSVFSPSLLLNAISWAAIAPGSGATCGISTSQTVYCWGANGLAELADGTTTDHYDPRPIAGSFSAAALSMGGGGACMRTTVSQAFCWGYNSDGQVGDGTLVTRTNAVPVIGISAESDNSTVTVGVLPSFMFAVANRATVCNGESDFNASAGGPTTVALGHIALSSNVSGGQDLSVSSNGVGFTVYIRSLYASGNMRSAGHQWADVVGTYGSPAALGSGERFGYTYADDTVSSSVTDPASGFFVALDSTDRAVMGSATSQSGSGCVAFGAQTSGATPAGNYAANIVYTAIPTF